MLNNVEKLLYLRGVAAEYFNYAGDRVCVPREDRLKMLAAVGYDVEDSEAMQRAVFELDALPWKNWLQAFSIVTVGDVPYFDIRIHPHERNCVFDWEVITAAGARISGSLIPAESPEVGEYYIDAIRYSAHRQLLADLPAGYHQLTLSSGGKQASAVLAVAPQRCFEGNRDSAGQQRWWGISCQLYTLRSSRNWGIGDFADLQELIELSAAAGMDMVGLNPLHAPHMAAADFASPYSPSDRRFLNPLYIDPERVPDYSASDKVCSLVKSPVFVRKLTGLRARELVDYDGVTALKYWVFEEMFRVFRQRELRQGSERAKRFHNFVRQHGEPLQSYSLHESEHGGARVHCASDPRFHQYLQWLADEQLQQCQTQALALGMKIGLMRDLAVGAVRGGAEVEGKAELFCDVATIGAPPDPFSEHGQNWNLPALDPVALRRDNYHHFIQLLRANMCHCGALRIDHVMGLLRLWWCLPDTSDGCYVYYPLEDLLAILRLESHRNQCAVIGEDMGVVPADLRATMAATGVYCNKLFYFERTQDEQFLQPDDQPEDALLMVTNHDVPTLAGWWNGTDLELREQVGLLDAEREKEAARLERQQDKQRLLGWLQSQQLLPDSWSMDVKNTCVTKQFDIVLCEAILNANARSRSKMMLFQLDDLQLLEEPVNIPGTYREYPNWRRKQRTETGTLFADPRIQAVLASTHRERMQ